jgi:predicted methyltransferase
MLRIIAFFLCLLATPIMHDTSSLAGTERPDNKAFSSLPVALMDDPRRTEWQQPERVVAQLQIQPGDSVADIGAGTGYFTFPFSQKVGESGTVYALDVDESLIAALKLRARNEGRTNIRALLTPPNDPALPKSSTDLIFLCDTHIFIEKRVTYFVRLRESLKETGRLAIISFNMKPEIPGAPPRQMRISREQTIQEAEQAGFVLKAEHSFLPNQYFLVFGKKPLSSR